MKKDTSSQPPTSKLSAIFETKPLIISLVALTLCVLLWHLPPYYQNLISTTAVSVATDNSTSLPTTVSLSEQKYSSPAAPVDPNKRVFKSYGNAAALFVQMGAYRGGATTFAVVGLASKPIHVFGRPWYKCEWVSNNGTSVKTKAIKMLPDWGYGRVYTVVVVNCTFATNPNEDNVGGKLVIYAHYGESQSKYEKFTALEESPASCFD